MIGFTGTQHGMTTNQRESVEALMTAFARAIEIGGQDVETIPVHHGLCVGADEQLNEIAFRLRFRTVGHEASDVPGRKVARVEVDDRADPRPAMERNTLIASMPIVVAAPFTYMEVRRSGTWATVRRARKSTVTRLWIVDPDGRVAVE